MPPFNQARPSLILGGEFGEAVKQSLCLHLRENRAVNPGLLQHRSLESCSDAWKDGFGGRLAVRRPFWHYSIVDLLARRSIRSPLRAFALPDQSFENRWTGAEML